MTSAERATAFRDHYAVLGVDVDSGEAEIKAAFWELAKRHHPDVNPGGVRAAPGFAPSTEATNGPLSRHRPGALPPHGGGGGGGAPRARAGGAAAARGAGPGAAAHRRGDGGAHRPTPPP